MRAPNRLQHLRNLSPISPTRDRNQRPRQHRARPQEQRHLRQGRLFPHEIVGFIRYVMILSRQEV